MKPGRRLIREGGPAGASFFYAEPAGPHGGRSGRQEPGGEGIIPRGKPASIQHKNQLIKYDKKLAILGKM